MLKKIVVLTNLIIVIINVVVLIALLVWSLLGVWEIMNIEQVLYWKVFISLIAVLLFNLILIYVVVGLYRKNAKLTDLFADYEQSQDYDINDIIFREGDNERLMYLVLKGNIELFSEDSVFEQVEPGGFFGEMAIIDNLPRTASARCLTPCKLIVIDEKRFYTMFSQVPFFAKEIMQAMSQRIRRHGELD